MSSPCNDCVAPTPHGEDQMPHRLLRDVVPGCLEGVRQLLDVLHWSRKMPNVMIQGIPQMFEGVQIRGHGWPWDQTIDISSLQEDISDSGSMCWGIVLHEDQGSVLLKERNQMGPQHLINVTDSSSVASDEHKRCVDISCNARPHHHTPSSLTCCFMDTSCMISFTTAAVNPHASIMVIQNKPGLVRKQNLSPLVACPPCVVLSPVQPRLNMSWLQSDSLSVQQDKP